MKYEGSDFQCKVRSNLGAYEVKKGGATWKALISPRWIVTGLHIDVCSCEQIYWGSIALTSGNIMVVTKVPDYFTWLKKNSVSKMSWLQYCHSIICGS